MRGQEGPQWPPLYACRLETWVSLPSCPYTPAYPPHPTWKLKTSALLDICFWSTCISV